MPSKYRRQTTTQRVAWKLINIALYLVSGYVAVKLLLMLYRAIVG